MGRTPCCDKVGLNRGRWTKEEDETLIKYIQQNGEGSWRSLPKNAGLQRCGKSCRLRWINYLRSDLKRGNFTAEEEEAIVKLHTSLGNRWSLIASQLPGRTDNEIKNYWNSHLSRRIYSFRSISLNRPMSALAEDVAAKMAAAGARRRRGGRVSRSVAKKYSTASFHVATSSFQKKNNKYEPHVNTCAVHDAPKATGDDGDSAVNAAELETWFPDTTYDDIVLSNGKEPAEKEVLSYSVGPGERQLDCDIIIHDEANREDASEEILLVAVNDGSGERCGSDGPESDGGRNGLGLPTFDDDVWVNWSLDDEFFQGYDDEFWKGLDEVFMSPWDK